MITQAKVFPHIDGDRGGKYIGGHPDGKYGAGIGLEKCLGGKGGIIGEYSMPGQGSKYPAGKSGAGH